MEAAASVRGFAAEPGPIAAQAGGGPAAIALGLEACAHRDIPDAGEPWQFFLHGDRLRKVRRRERRYLLRMTLVGRDPAQMGRLYTQLVQVEEAFKNLKGGLAIRPILHRTEERMEAHISVAFMAYSLHVTLRRPLIDLAPGLPPGAVLEKFGALQMIDVHLPTMDARKVITSRYTRPQPELQVLLRQFRLSLPNQPPPCVTVKGKVTQYLPVVKIF